MATNKKPGRPPGKKKRPGGKPPHGSIVHKIPAGDLSVLDDKGLFVIEDLPLPEDARTAATTRVRAILLRLKVGQCFAVPIKYRTTIASVNRDDGLGHTYQYQVILPEKNNIRVWRTK